VPEPPAPEAPPSGPSPCPADVDGRPRVVARGDTGHGELVLRRRGEVTELIVDGVFAMDSACTSTEIALATLTLDRLAGGPGPVPPVADGPGPGWRVLVGGLGLGFTTAAVLADPRVAAVEVVELQELLPRWLRDGLLPSAAGLLDDPRLRLITGDVREAIELRRAASLDALLLDIDNGPLFLVHGSNAEVYREPFLRRAIRTLTPGGVLAIWSADPSPELAALLRAAGAAEVEEVPLDVQREGRRLRYAVYLARAS
jgi:spermidine synthase